MIDKKIFYCWFGQGEMSDLNKKCINSWKKYCPDYEIIEINETNFDYNITPYAKQAYEHKNWSYVSNAARLETLKNNSGFYLDTDVQLVQSLDSFRVFDDGFITEFDSGQPDSGVLGCNKFPKFYEEVYNRLVPGTILHKEFIQVMYRDYDVRGEKQIAGKDNFYVIGEEFFPSIRTGLITDKTIGIHHFENTWVKQWRNIQDDFYPYQRVRVKIKNKIIHEDENANILFTLKTLFKPWNAEDMIGRINYFFNPKVIKLSCRDFDAERLNVRIEQQNQVKTLITPSGLIVNYID